MISIVIIFEQKEDREAIINVLSTQADFEIAGTGKDGYDALKTAMDLQPDVVIMDMRMTGISAPELAPMIKRKSPGTALIVLCSARDEHLVNKAIKAGISGYLLKETDMYNLAELVRIIFYGGCYISTPIIYRIFSAISGLEELPGSVEDFSTFQNEKERIFREFSPTERRIFSLLAQGYSDQEIADELNISQGTVRNSLSAARRKTGLRSRTHMVIYALIYGLISLDKTTILKETIDRLALIPYNKQNGGSYANRMRDRSGNPKLQAGHL
jgi:DNA-binding NarL/FixJ family response regulator